ncbi:MAG: DUF2804 domain-containing protein [Polyangiaceae bacterium]
MTEQLVAPLPTPCRIVEADGQVHVGWFRDPVVDVNLAAAAPRHALAGLRGGPLDFVERGFRQLRLKRWLYLSAVSPEAFVGFAVVHAGYAGSAFAYVVDRSSGRRYEWSTLAPLGRGVHIAPSSVSGTTSIDQRGFGRIVIERDPRAWRATLELDGQLGKAPRPPLDARLEVVDEGRHPSPVVVVEESAPGAWLYTHKCYGLAASGRLACGAFTSKFDHATSHAGLDYNCGFRPRETWWNWAAAGGFDRAGRRVGFNLTAHRPWAQEAASDADAADCALWLPGGTVKIPKVTFDYAPERRLEPWRIRDGEGLVDLVFEPEGERHEDVDLGVVVSRFHQPYGRFRGTLRSREGEVSELDDVFGVTEQHFARW